MKGLISSELENLLLSCIVAVGVREEGTVRDLDTLIIDRQQAVAKLESLLRRVRIDELNANHRLFFEHLKPDITAMHWITPIFEERLRELEAEL